MTQQVHLYNQRVNKPRDVFIFVNTTTDYSAAVIVELIEYKLSQSNSTF